MRFNQAGQSSCYNYHPNYLGNLTKALGYSKFIIGEKSDENACRLAWLDANGNFQTTEGNMDLVLPRVVSFTI